MSSNRIIMKESLANFNNSSTAEQTSPEVKSAISDQNFPTQSEIIDALAIYMARRFKQEVALTWQRMAQCRFKRFTRNAIQYGCKYRYN